MCKQCTANIEIIFENFLGKYAIGIAGKTDEEIKEGDVCLIIRDDPDFVIPKNLIMKDILWNSCDKEINDCSEEVWKLSGQFYKNCEKVNKIMENQSTVSSGYILYSAMLNSGYKPEDDGYNWTAWLTQKLALILEEEVDFSSKM